MKNRPDGSIATAVDAIKAAAVPHVFTGIDHDGAPAILHTRGNPDCHLVLRGSDAGPNYDADSVAAATDLLRKAGLPERVVIDASHGNSRKDHRRQPVVAAEIGAAGRRRQQGDRRRDAGVVPGRGPPGARPDPPLTYGQSITDACLGWETTERSWTDCATPRSSVVAERVSISGECRSVASRWATA